MPARTLATTAVVLDRQASGESWRRLVCLSREEGRLECLQRLARRDAANTPALDLFDEVRLGLETRNEGRTWFVREAVPLRRRTALGGSYEALRQACRFARILAHNPIPEESRETVFDLLDRGLSAWEAHERPDAVYFKCLYLLARDEGYPVRQDWCRRLDAADRPRVEAILREPAAAQATAPADTARLAAALEHYLRHETPIRIDEP